MTDQFDIYFVCDRNCILFIVLIDFRESEADSETEDNDAEKLPQGSSPTRNPDLLSPDPSSGKYKNFTFVNTCVVDSTLQALYYLHTYNNTARMFIDSRIDFDKELGIAGC